MKTNADEKMAHDIPHMIRTDVPTPLCCPITEFPYDPPIEGWDLSMGPTFLDREALKKDLKDLEQKERLLRQQIKSLQIELDSCQQEQRDIHEDLKSFK